MLVKYISLQTVLLKKRSMFQGQCWLCEMPDATCIKDGWIDYAGFVRVGFDF